MTIGGLDLQYSKPGGPSLPWFSVYHMRHVCAPLLVGAPSCDCRVVLLASALCELLAFVNLVRACSMRVFVCYCVCGGSCVRQFQVCNTVHTGHACSCCEMGLSLFGFELVWCCWSCCLCCGHSAGCQVCVVARDHPVHTVFCITGCVVRNVSQLFWLTGGNPDACNRWPGWQWSLQKSTMLTEGLLQGPGDGFLSHHGLA
jgi:hypothetical protein